MVQLHMTEAEISGIFSDVLAKVRDGVEVVVEHDHRPVAVIRPAQPSGRPISESDFVRVRPERRSIRG